MGCRVLWYLDIDFSVNLRFLVGLGMGHGEE